MKDIYLPVVLVYITSTRFIYFGLMEVIADHWVADPDEVFRYGWIMVNLKYIKLCSDTKMERNMIGTEVIRGKICGTSFKRTETEPNSIPW